MIKISVIFKLLANPKEIRGLFSQGLTFPKIDKYLFPIYHFIVILTLGTLTSTVVMQKYGFNLQIKESKYSATTVVNLKFPPPISEKEFKSILERNLFNSEGAIVVEAKTNQCELKKSELPIKFVGLIYGGTTETSVVVLELNSTKQSDIFLGNDKIPNTEAKIVAIEKDRVIFMNNSCPEFIALEKVVLPTNKRVTNKKVLKKTATKENGANYYSEEGFERNSSTIVADHLWIQKELSSNLAKNLQDVRATPYNKDGQIKGFLLTNLKQNSIYEKMGLANGDVIESIDDVELNSVPGAINMLNSVRDNEVVNIKVNRNGSIVDLTINRSK